MDEQEYKTLGIFGYGSFGEFLAHKLAPYFEVLVHSSKSARELMLPKNARAESLKAVAECDVVIPAIPLSAYQQWCRNVAPYLKPAALVVDVCSVKVKPVDILLAKLPSHVQILATHPLFGPQSAADSLEGHLIVVEPIRIKDYELVKKFLAETLKLDVVEMDPDTHDQKMALVHGLTFFLSRGLMQMQLKDNTLTAPSYKKLLSLADLEAHHSKDLFETVESGNPYAAQVRKQFIKALSRLDKESRKIKF